MALTYTSISLFIVSTFIFCVATVQFDTQTMEYTILDFIDSISWNLAQLMVYLLLFERVYHAFHGTKYSVNKCNIISFTILLLSYSIVGIVAFVPKIWLPSSSPWKDISGDIYVIGEEIIDLMLSIYLIAMFIIKLLQITVDLNDNISEKFINAEIAVLNEQQKKLINIMTKYFMLSFIATLITQLESLVYGVGHFVWYYDNDWTLYISWILWPIDCAVNSVCLFLIFDMNNEWYLKSCKGFHACIKLWFKRVTKRRIQKKYSDYDNVELEINLLNDYT